MTTDCTPSQQETTQVEDDGVNLLMKDTGENQMNDTDLGNVELSRIGIP